MIIVFWQVITTQINWKVEFKFLMQLDNYSFSNPSECMCHVNKQCIISECNHIIQNQNYVVDDNEELELELIHHTLHLFIVNAFEWLELGKLDWEPWLINWLLDFGNVIMGVEGLKLKWFSTLNFCLPLLWFPYL